MPRRPDDTRGTEVEAMERTLLARFGPDFVSLVRHMGLSNAAHLRELLQAGDDEQSQLVMAWMKAAAALESEWAADARRSGEAQMSLARYLEIRLPSPRNALLAYEAEQARRAAAAVPEKPPTPEERMSAQRRIRLERAIEEAREALQRVDAVDRLVEADRQAIVAQLEDVLSLISRRLRSAVPGRDPD
jgi:hypothetical protein